MRLSRRPRISEVFNANTEPHPDVFTARIEGRGTGRTLQQRVAGVLAQPGKHLVLWGYTGVGKTSLLRHTASQLKLQCLTVQARKPIDERQAIEVLLANILAELGYERLLTTHRAVGRSSSFEFKSPIHKGGIGQKDSEEVISAIESHSLDRAVVLALSASNYRILFIDAFEFIPAHERRGAAEVLLNMMHELSDASSRKPSVAKIVVAGIADAVQEIVPTADPAVRRLEQIHVPTMTVDQLSEIIDSGAKLLRLQFTADAREAIVEASDGFPFYTHHFAFHAIEEARRRSAARTVREVTFEDHTRSLSEALNLAQLRLAMPYLQAIETAQNPQIRKRVLEAFASIGHNVVSLNDIQESYLHRNPHEPEAHDLAFFQNPVGELVRDYRLLVEVPLNSEDGPLYRFRDPLMRAYVRLHARYPRLVVLHRDEAFAG